jgi:hypothetical protein
MAGVPVRGRLYDNGISEIDVAGRKASEVQGRVPSA